MRTIKFRARAFEKVWGTNIENGDWVYGNYFEESIDIEDNITFQTQYFIKSPYGDHYQDIRIDIKTLGQFTGLIDKNGKEVFENDIVKWSVNTKINKEEFQRFAPFDRYSIVEINPDIQFMQLFCINLTNNEKFISFEQVIKYGKYNFENAEFEVIGNIYENPELLEIKQ